MYKEPFTKPDTSDGYTVKRVAAEIPNLLERIQETHQIDKPPDY